MGTLRQLLKISLFLAFSSLLSSRVQADVFPPWGGSCGDDKTETNFTGSYFILAPQTIRPGLQYAVSVNLLKAFPDPMVVMVALRNDKNESLAQTYARDVQAGTPVTATFEEVPVSLVNQQYKLYVRGESASGKLYFEDEKSVSFNSHAHSVFVQTDKAVYKPGGEVKFRVIAVKPDLKPFQGAVNVQIADPNNNVIAQFLKQPLRMGVFTKYLKLNEEPTLGAWMIKVKSLNEEGNQVGDEETKSFDVDKYVLPKFEVKLDVPSFSTIEKDIPVSVEVKYTYGKGVRGIGTITAKYPWDQSWRSNDDGEPRYPPIMQKVVLDKKGTASVTFKNSDLKRSNLITEYGYNNIKFEASFTEELTGIVRNATEEITIYKTGEKLTIVKSGESFKPGLNYSALVKVTTPDESEPIKPTSNRKVFVKITYTYPYKPEFTKEPTITSLEIQLDEDGTKAISTSPPQDADRLTIEARYGSQDSDSFEVASVAAMKSPSNSFLQLSRQTDQTTVKAGELIGYRVKASGNFGVNVVTMQVMARGRVVLSQKVELSDADLSGDFNFPTTTEMAPKSRVVVYAIRPENQEVLVDAMDFSVEGLFDNKVSVEIVPDKVKPFNSDGTKTEVEIKVKADPNSFVGLLAVDQSVRLLKKGNDITTDLIEDEISQYDSLGYSGGGWGGRGGGIEFAARRAKRSFWFPWGINGKDADTILQNSGMVALTDAYLYKECLPPRPMFRGGFGGRAGVGGPVPNLANFAGPVPAPAPAPQSSGGGFSAKAKPTPVKVRKEFPESWIWTEETISEDGTMTYRATVPDTITSWIASAFATNDQTGLGVAPNNAKLQVFRNFFVSLNLPYSVKQGEVFALQALVFNYGSNPEAVDVKLDHSATSGFDFVKKANGKGGKESNNYNVRRVTIPAGGSESVKFPITPTTNGVIKLTVTAAGKTMNDAVERNLIVEPEGMRVYFNKPMVIDLTEDGASFEETVQMTPPTAIASQIVDGSERSEFSVIGDIMGPILSSLENLVRMPYGCGEQNMLGFVPNIVVRRYLEATGGAEKHAKLIEKTTKFMESGYQRELNYKRNDNSFSAFGQSDPHGSTWLTAFVVRSYQEAQDYIYVDQDIVRKCVEFLISMQKENGEFEERGEIHHKAMQGGASEGGVPLTAYVLIALLKAGQRNEEAINYLEQSLSKQADNPYALAITAYALHMANSAKKEDALRMLEEKAINQDGMRHWEDKVGEENPDAKPWWYDGPRPVDVEMTSYAVLTYMQREQVKEAFPSIRWLSSKRNSEGGFSSTQDTVMGINALGAYAEKTYSPDTRVRVDIRQRDSSPVDFRVSAENAIVLQKSPLNGLGAPITVTSSGKGMAFAQVSWHYNVYTLDSAKPFECSNDLTEKDGGNEFLINLCCKYALKGRSNMAVIEIEAPSGFEIDSDKLNELPKVVKDLQRVETQKGDTAANVYFNSIGVFPVCFNVTGQKVFQVAEQKPSQIKVFDYYEPDKAIQMTYNAAQTKSLEDQCDDCWQDLSADDVSSA